MGGTGRSRWRGTVILRDVLMAQGVQVLAVVRSRSTPDLFTVYLHGNAGNQHHQRAFQILATMRAVERVYVSAQSPAILIVRQRSSSRD